MISFHHPTGQWALLPPTVDPAPHTLRLILSSAVREKPCLSANQRQEAPIRKAAEKPEPGNREDGAAADARGDRPYRNQRNRPTSDAGISPGNRGNDRGEEHEDFDEDDLARLREKSPWL